MKTLFILLILPSLIYSQTTGYFGRKNVVDFNMSLSTPLTYKLIESYGDNFYKLDESNHRLVKKKDVIDYAYNISVSRVIFNHFSVGFETSFEHSDTEVYASRTANQSGSFGDYGGNYERLLIESFVFIPKIEFTRKNNFLPMGIYHQVGFGFRNSRLVKKDYAYEFVKYDDYGGEFHELTASDRKDISEKFFDYSKNSFKSFVLTYSINMRRPLTKFLLFNYGFSYTINLKRKEDLSGYTVGYVDPANSYYITHRELENDIYIKRLYNFMQFKIGFTFVF